MLTKPSPLHAWIFPLCSGLLAWFGLTAVPTAGFAAAPTFACRWTDEPITIDGKADEPAWKNAELINQFQLPSRGTAERPALAKTTARLLWDREFLYFHAEMEDADVSAKVTEHDGKTWNDDVFELFFKPSSSHPGYYEFEINAANAVLDMFLPSRVSDPYSQFKSDRKFHLDTAVLVRGSLNDSKDKDTGWSVEGRIPWRDLVRTGGRPEIDEVWSFALCRYDYTAGSKAPELSSSAPLQEPDFHRYEDYSRLKFLGPSPGTAKVGIDERPLWTNSHVVGSPDPPLPYHAVRVFSNLNVHLPIALLNEPGSDRMLLLEHEVPWSGAGTLRRFRAEPNVKEAETLLDLDDIAYGMTFHPGFK